MRRHWLLGSNHLRYVPSLQQCGTQLTRCFAVSGTTCVALNAYYSQCQPGAAAPAPTSAPAPSPTQPAGPAPSDPSTPTGPGLSSIPASTLHQITNFGTNPNNVGMFVYKPARVAANPPLIVASHCSYIPSHGVAVHQTLMDCIYVDCSGTAQAYFSGSKFAQLAETYGYVVLFPNSVSFRISSRTSIHPNKPPFFSPTPALAGTSRPMRHSPTTAVVTPSALRPRRASRSPTGGSTRTASSPSARLPAP